MGTQGAFEPDDVMRRVGAGIALRDQGEPEAARRLFTELWDDIGGESGDAFHRCAVAHSMADVQADPVHELAWDLRALHAADELTDQRVADAGVSGPAALFYPSLHLNLGECHRKLGNVDRARHHLQAGLAASNALPDDGYSTMVRRGLEALQARLTRD